MRCPAAEVSGLVAFYKSPLGQALIEKTPAVTQESMVVGQQWGRTKAQEIVKRLQAEGYEPPGR